MKKVTLNLLIGVSSVFCFAQTPTITWEKSLGGTLSDQARAIQQTTDGGYIVVGNSLSTDGDVTGNHGKGDIWVTKLNATGNITWQKALGGSESDQAEAIQQTSDGGYIIAGRSKSNDGDVPLNQGSDDYWVVKIDATGNIVWSKTYGGSAIDFARSVHETTDGNYIVAGSTQSTDGDVIGHQPGSINHDFWILKLNSATGAIIWQKILGGTGADMPASIQQTADGGYIIVGSSDSNDGDVTGNHQSGGSNTTDVWVVKLDGTGNLTWQKSLGGSFTEQASLVRQTLDGGYIISAYSQSSDGDLAGITNHGSYDAWIIKLDATGNITWQKLLGGTKSDQANSIKQTIDGGYIVAATSYSNDGDVSGNFGGAALYAGDYWIVKLNATGNITWEKNFGGTGLDQASDIQQTTDGGYIVAGFSNSIGDDITGNKGNYDYWVVKLGLNCTAITKTENLSHCGPFTWTNGNGQTYTSSTSVVYTFVNGAANGCDSTVTLNLTINQPVTTNESHTACGSYTWTNGNGQTYNSSTVVNYTIPNGAQNGCDSTVTLNLTINPVATNSITHTACDSYTWTNGNGQTYNSSTVVNYTIPNGAQNGCDSTVTLNLTINHSNSSTQNITQCGPFTWTNGNGQTYTSSTSVTHTIPNGNVNGCDSTVTLNLTINQPVTTNESHTACGSYTWTNGNGLTYTSSSVVTYTIPNGAQNGCDSTVVLDLTINPIPTHSITHSACNSYTWTNGNGQTYTSSTVVTHTIPNGAASGCDSIVTLNLTINHAGNTIVYPVACKEYQLNGITYNESGTYTQTLTGFSGCDSIVSIELTLKTDNIDKAVTKTGNTLRASENNASYQWFDCTTLQAIQGATSQSFSPTSNGKYGVAITKDGCTDSSECISITTIGVNEQENNTQLSIYPNPAKNTVNIQVNSSTNINVAYLRIIDIAGRTVYNTKTNIASMENQLIQVDISHLPSGIYQIQLLNYNDINIVQKLIIE